jgi:hypothetical protein
MTNVNVELSEKSSIKEALDTLESRIKSIMDEFERLDLEVTERLSQYHQKNISLDDIKDPKITELLNKMLNLFMELKPIERLIRFKYKEYSRIFDMLQQIEGERIHGKFFSFLAALPNKKRLNTKNVFIQRSLTNNPSIT